MKWRVERRMLLIDSWTSLMSNGHANHVEAGWWD